MSDVQVPEHVQTVRPGSTNGPGSLAPWLVAVAACTALVVVLAGARVGRSHPAPTATPVPLAALPVLAKAGAVENVFRQMKPYAVQRGVGPSGAKAADCSIYSDGDLDNGANVTWAVTLCVVHLRRARPG
ncbi:MAG: hypothetical protein ACRDN6_15185 [Gaiellaceae bacterium]